MKKIVFLFLIAMSVCFATQAQTGKEVKPTSSVTQTVHNTFSKHKKHNGYKVKSADGDAVHKKKVNTATGEVKTKTKKP